jgi:hypothetical protein
MYSLEFFNQRSFEVVWAVFRVAQYVSRPKLRQTLEDRALDYFVARNGATLDALEETIRLSANIGEIGKTNAGVLLRETGTLRAALLEFKEKNIAVAAGDNLTRANQGQADRKEEPSIDGIFSRPPMLLADFMGMIADSMGKARTRVADVQGAEPKEKDTVAFQPVAADEGPAMGSVKSGNDTSSIYIDKTDDFSQSAKPIGNEFGKESGNAASNRQKELANKSAPIVSTVGNTKASSAISAVYRQSVIIEQLSRKTYSTLRDIAEILPGVSERTLRYDIQRMVDKKIVERVGGGGPHSFLRLKKGKTAGTAGASGSDK